MGRIGSHSAIGSSLLFVIFSYLIVVSVLGSGEDVLRAIRSRDWSQVEHLLREGASDMLNKESDKQVVLDAVEAGIDQDLLRLLLHSSSPELIHLAVNFISTSDSMQRPPRAPIADAILSGRWDLVSLLVSAGAEALLDLGDGRTPLYLAVSEGVDAEMLVCLLENTNESPEDHHIFLQRALSKELNPLVAAIRRRRQDLAEILVEYGADATARVGDKWSPFTLAIEYGMNEKFFLLVMSKLTAGDIQRILDSCQRKPLVDAIRKRDWPLATFFLRAGAALDVKAVDKGEWTNPLAMAIAYDADEAFLQIIFNTLSPEKVVELLNHPFRPPLIEAIKRRKWDLAQFLLERGADPTIVADNGGTGLVLAAQKAGQNAQFFKMILDSARSLKGRTEINMELSSDEQASKGLMFDRVEQQEKELQDLVNAAFSEAIVAHNWALLPLLLEYGADVTKLNYPNYTPIHSAVVQDVPATVLESILSSSSEDKILGALNEWALPLQTALGKKRWDLAIILVKYGADVNKINSTMIERLKVQLAADAQASRSLRRIFAMSGSMTKNAGSRPSRKIRV